MSTPCRAWLTDLPDALATAERLVALTLTHAGLNRRVLDYVEVGVTLTDDDAIRALNRDYRQQDKATNVLSFGDDGMDDGPHDLPHGQPLLLGDLILAHGVMCAEAKAQGKSLHNHYCHLLVHGTLHLLGHEHLEEGDAAAMEAWEIAILAGIGIANPYELDAVPPSTTSPT